MRTANNIRSIWAPVFSIAIALIFTAGVVEARPNSSFGDGLDKKRDAIQALFAAKGEDPTAKGATWSQADIFLVGIEKGSAPVKDFADYVCQVVIDYGLSGKDITVQIVDIKELFNTAGGFVFMASKKCDHKPLPHSQ